MTTPVDEENTNSASGDAEEENDILCSPCQGDGRILEAVGYCVNCKEYLCAECFKCHRVPTFFRKHVLLDKDEMTKDVATRDNNNCPNHDNRRIEFHCKGHSFLGCYVCFFQHQKTCKDVIHIEEVSETFSGTDELKTFMSKLELNAKKSSDLLTEIRKNIDDTKNCHSEAITALREFKAQIVDAIDKLEKDLIKKAKTFLEAQTSQLNEFVNTITTILDANQTLTTEIEVLLNKDQHSDLYIAVVRSVDKLLALDNELLAIENNKVVQFSRFEGNNGIAETLKTPWGLGKLVTNSSIDKVEFVTDINVKSADDTQNCDICCSVLMPGNTLVVTDYYNKYLKLITTRQHKLIATMKLSNVARGVAKVTDSTVAVTIPDNRKIVFVKMDPSLGINRELTVNGSCWGVAYKDGKLVVTFATPNKVEIMDVQGNLLLSIDKDTSGRDLFHNAYHVTINPEHNFMYVSNCGRHEVMCLRLDGSVVAVSKDSELQYPCQAVVDSTGMVYVCALNSRTLTQMTPDCKKVRTLLTSADGLSTPRSISFDETESKFYIGECRNTVKVYRVRCSAI